MPELTHVEGYRYENSPEQRRHRLLKEEMKICSRALELQVAYRQLAEIWVDSGLSQIEEA